MVKPVALFRCKRAVLPCPVAYFMSSPVWSWTWNTIPHRYTSLWQRRNVYLIHGNPPIPRFIGNTRPSQSLWRDPQILSFFSCFLQCSYILDRVIIFPLRTEHLPSIFTLDVCAQLLSSYMLSCTRNELIERIFKSCVLQIFSQNENYLFILYLNTFVTNQD